MRPQADGRWLGSLVSLDPSQFIPSQHLERWAYTGTPNVPMKLQIWATDATRILYRFAMLTGSLVFFGAVALDLIARRMEYSHGVYALLLHLPQSHLLHRYRWRYPPK